MPTEPRWSTIRALPCALFAAALVLGACSRRPAEEPSVVSHLRGVITVRAEVDSVRDYRGFEVLVASADGLADTLGIAVTDSTGSFEMTLTAPEKGVYPLLVRRRGALLKQGQIVIADGDSAALNLRLPDGRRPLVIRSNENAAWLAYLNTKAVHNRELLALVQSGDLSSAGRESRFMQTAQLLWNLAQQFRGTIGAEIAAAESILMLEGIDDSLVVARANELSVDGPGFVDVARAVRRAGSRLHGLDAAISILEGYSEAARQPRQRAALASEIVLALVDSGRVDSAIARARDLRSRYADTEWAEWAGEAVYELETLMPGMQAPTFQARTWTGGTFDLADELDGTVVLEFFRPAGEAFLREMALRDSLIHSISNYGVRYFAISIEPDSVLNEAFFESRDASDVQIALPNGLDGPSAKAYNVKIVPKRFILHKGRIVGKYTGVATLGAIHRDVVDLASRPLSLNE